MNALIKFRTKEAIHGIEKGCIGKGILSGGQVIVPTDTERKNPRNFPFEKISILF